jgi:hypothetical protein
MADSPDLRDKPHYLSGEQKNAAAIASVMAVEHDIPISEFRAARNSGDTLLQGVPMGALGEVYLLPATLAEMRLVKLIGENFRFLAAILAFADKRLQVPQLFKSRAMLGRGHKLLLMLTAIRLPVSGYPVPGRISAV